MIKLFLVFIAVTYSFYSLSQTTLPDGPKSLISKSISTDKNNNINTHATQLKWSKIADARSYKVIIIRKDKHFRKIYYTASNQLTYSFVPNAPYAWKVVGRKDNEDVTRFSPFYDINIINNSFKNTETPENKINTIAWEKNTYQHTPSLPRGPGAKIPGEFRFNERRHLYPVLLKWEPVDNATLYEIEIIRLTSKRRMFYYSKTNDFPIEVSPNVDYHWRVIAYKDKTKITNYSYPFYLKVIYDPSGEELKSLSQSDQQKKLDSLEANEEKYFKSLKLNEQLRDQKIKYQQEKTKNLIKTKKIENQLNKAKNKSDSQNYANLQDQINELRGMIQNQKTTHQEEVKRLKDQLREEGKRSYSLHHWNKTWARAGVGLRFTRYDQDINSTTNAAVERNQLFHATNGDVSFNLSGAHYFKPRIGIEGQLVYSNGSFLEASDKIFIDYTWMELHLEGIYIFDEKGYNTKKDHWFARAGLLYQSLSLLASFPAPSTVYELLDSSHYFLSGGAGYNKMLSQNFKVQSHASLLFQVLGSTSKFSYSPEFGYGVNAHTRIEYLLSEDFQLGMDWQLQFIEISYNLSNGTQKVDGRQNLIQNKLGLYLNYIF